MDLIIVGSIALDNVETPSGVINDSLGGSAVYASVSSSYFCKTGIVGICGEDFNKSNIELLHKHKIDTQGLDIVKGKTFRWAGRYENLNQAQTLDTQLNVFADFNPVLPNNYLNSKYLLLGNIDPVLQKNVCRQSTGSKIIAMDTMNYWIDGHLDNLLKVIKLVDILFINEDELRMLTDEKNIFKAADKATKMGPEMVIVKRGEYGAFAFKKDFLFFAPVFPVTDVVDPTGAGDSFAGGFMGYLAKTQDQTDESIKKAMIYATVMASINVEDFSINKLKDTDFDNIEKRVEFLKNSVNFN